MAVWFSAGPSCCLTRIDWPSCAPVTRAVAACAGAAPYEGEGAAPPSANENEDAAGLAAVESPQALAPAGAAAAAAQKAGLGAAAPQAGPLAAAGAAADMLEAGKLGSRELSGRPGEPHGPTKSPPRATLARRNNRRTSARGCRGLGSPEPAEKPPKAPGLPPDEGTEPLGAPNAEKVWLVGDGAPNGAAAPKTAGGDPARPLNRVGVAGSADS